MADQLFNEQKLYEEICKIWGPHGAHALVYTELCKRLGLELEPVTIEPIAVAIRRIYNEEDKNMIKTVKRVRYELDNGQLGLKEALALVKEHTGAS